MMKATIYRNGVLKLPHEFAKFERVLIVPMPGFLILDFVSHSEYLDYGSKVQLNAGAVCPVVWITRALKVLGKELEDAVGEYPINKGTSKDRFILNLKRNGKKK